MQKHKKNSLFNIIRKKIYCLLWFIFYPIFKQKPTFIISHGLHYEMIKNILPYMKSYRIYPATTWAKEYLIENKISFSKYLFFPKTIVEASFSLSAELRWQYYLSFQALLEINKVKRIQTYHGVADKNHTYSKFNMKYDLLLVPGRYARNRLLKIGVLADRIKIVGYPKLDGYFKIRKSLPRRPKNKPIIVYAPTWGIISSIPYMFKSLISMHKKYHLVVKPHYFTDWYYLDYLKELNIKIYKKEDVSELFRIADVLISDSSSIMFEFLLTGKPVIAIDVMNWAQGVALTNSSAGPEILFRHLFFRVRDIRQLNRKIKKALNANRINPAGKKILNELFEPVYPAGQKAAHEIQSFIETQ